MEKTLDIDGLTLHYDETGAPQGVPIVLMHGWGCNSSTLASIVDIVSPSMHVFNLDLPGHGKTPEPPEVWGVEQYTSFVENFLEKAGIQNPVVLGHSFGGRISILMGSRRQLRKILLVDAAGIKPRRPLKYYVKVYSFKTAKKLLPIIVGRSKAAKILNQWRGKAGSADYKQASPMMRAILSRCVNEDLKHVMPQIKAPTLLIWGENDTATPLSDAKTMEKLIPDAGLVAFPGCGHYSFLDNPGGFRAVVREFLKKELAGDEPKN